MNEGPEEPAVRISRRKCSLRRKQPVGRPSGGHSLQPFLLKEANRVLWEKVNILEGLST